MQAVKKRKEKKGPSLLKGKSTLRGRAYRYSICIIYPQNFESNHENHVGFFGMGGRKASIRPLGYGFLSERSGESRTW